MYSLKLNGLKNQLNTASLMLRLMLGRNEVFRLPATSRGIEVVAGTAWVTVNGRDIFLTSRERLWLPSRRDSALISALGRNPLILEVFGLPLEGKLTGSWNGRGGPGGLAAPGSGGKTERSLMIDLR
jgi:hypothetical protein